MENKKISEENQLVLDVLVAARNIIFHPRYWTKYTDAREFVPSLTVDNPLMQSPFDFYMPCDPTDKNARMFTAVGAIDRVIGKIDWKSRNKKFRKKSIKKFREKVIAAINACLLYTSPSPRDRQKSRMPSSA